MKYLPFKEMLDQKKGGEWLAEIVKQSVSDKQLIYHKWYKQTGEAGEIYPSQGLLKTPFDYLDFLGKTLMNEDELWEVLQMRWWLLSVFNHPTRLEAMEKVDELGFQPPDEIKSKVMDYVMSSGLAISVNDLGARIVGTDRPRVGRRNLLMGGPFVKLGKWARIPFSSGAMPDVFGAPAALATMAMCHGLACVPRNGVFNQVKRQVDLVKATFSWMREEEVINGYEHWRTLLKRWRQNVVGVIEPELSDGQKRAEALYEAGVRTLRVYSPEPGTDAIKLIKALRTTFGDKVELFVGQVASVKQAQALEASGADGLYVGIGGGGRCITAVRSSSVVDWPTLVWTLRGKIKIPVIVEGGASDRVGTTLLLGASGIGVTRKAAGGTIESPGGLLYLVGKDGVWFKPYGGEASARTKFQDGKMMAMGMPAFVEGETTKAIKSYVPHIKPTIAAQIYILLEDLILSMVFRGVQSIKDLQAINPSPLRRVTEDGSRLQGTH